MLIKRKSIQVFISSLFLILIVLFLVRPYSRFLLTLFPPEDLYKPLFMEHISFKKNKNIYESSLKHIYTGTYFVGVYFNNPPPYGEPIISDVILELKFINNEKLIFNERYSKWINRIGGAGEKESGVILGYYKVPDNIPISQDITSIITVLTPDIELENKYGQMEFFIRRSVDQ